MSERIDIELSEVTSEEDVELIRNMMEDPHVWRNLARMEQPKRGKFHGLFQLGHYKGHHIVVKGTDKVIGFVLLTCGKLKSRGIIEVDIAITDEAYKGKGLSKLGLARTFDAWLLTDRCKEMWGWIDMGNTASIKMVEALEIPIIKRGVGDGRMADGMVDTVEIAFVKETWLRAKEKLGF